MNENDQRTQIRDHYARIAEAGGGIGCCGTGGGCGTAASDLGYGAADIGSAPDGADLGLGCGNPLALAPLREGETVLDLGSGAGFDCFLAAERVGPAGRVIGVDMTPEMIARARTNREKAGVENVEFRLGEIEHLPAADRSVDVILSNCVVNLAPDKQAVFAEAYRVLRPGGRLAIMDVVALAPLPDAVARRDDALPACLAGAATPGAVERALRRAGFERVRVTVLEKSAAIVRDWMPGTGLEHTVASAAIEAVRPLAKGCC